MHDSQDPPIVNYGDNRSFYEKIIDNNTCNDYFGKYIEKFEIITKEYFVNK